MLWYKWLVKNRFNLGSGGSSREQCKDKVSYTTHIFMTLRVVTLSKYENCIVVSPYKQASKHTAALSQPFSGLLTAKKHYTTYQPVLCVYMMSFKCLKCSCDMVVRLLILIITVKRCAEINAGLTLYIYAAKLLCQCHNTEASHTYWPSNCSPWVVVLVWENPF